MTPAELPSDSRESSGWFRRLLVGLLLASPFFVAAGLIQRIPMGWVARWGWRFDSGKAAQTTSWVVALIAMDVLVIAAVILFRKRLGLWAWLVGPVVLVGSVVCWPIAQIVRIPLRLFWGI